MADYRLNYGTKKKGEQGEHHTVKMSDLPNLAAAQAKARDQLTELQLQDAGIRITIALVKRLPAGNWHSVF